ncbi:hypothetical protein SAMN05192583_0549 [Sphingomonas gellani]|uniref:Uncharacterized protein n=1 Tax=Sphingomonas gellani TaxID=1166340 RepID=A0A1H7Z6A9_9SPHN|nr:hypothetical protein SAMN05192583_0549 [Sphingomonas gellani]
MCVSLLGSGAGLVVSGLADCFALTQLFGVSFVSLVCAPGAGVWVPPSERPGRRCAFLAGLRVAGAIRVCILWVPCSGRGVGLVAVRAVCPVRTMRVVVRAGCATGQLFSFPGFVCGVGRWVLIAGRMDVGLPIGVGWAVVLGVGAAAPPVVGGCRALRSVWSGLWGAVGRIGSSFAPMEFARLRGGPATLSCSLGCGWLSGRFGVSGWAVGRSVFCSGVAGATAALFWFRVVYWWGALGFFVGLVLCWPGSMAGSGPVMMASRRVALCTLVVWGVFGG